MADQAPIAPGTGEVAVAIHPCGWVATRLTRVPLAMQTMPSMFPDVGFLDCRNEWQEIDEPDDE